MSSEVKVEWDCPGCDRSHEAVVEVEPEFDEVQGGVTMAYLIVLNGGDVWCQPCGWPDNRERRRFR